MFSRTETFGRRLKALLPKASRILEIGPGDGQLAQWLAASGYAVVAVDRERRSSFPTIVSSFEEYVAGAARFDCIIAMLVLHHVVDLEKTLDKIASLLKPTGIVAIDDYGWERLDEATARKRWGVDWQLDAKRWRDERTDLHPSSAMVKELDDRFTRIHYTNHAYFDDGAGDDTLAFTFIGSLHEKPRSRGLSR